MFSIFGHFLVLWKVFLDDEVVDDEVLTLHGILSHIVFEELLHLIVLVEGHLFEAHVRSDEVDELVRAYLTKTLEARNLGLRTEVADGVEPLLLGVAVPGDEVVLLLLDSEAGIGILDDLLVLDF